MTAINVGSLIVSCIALDGDPKDIYDNCFMVNMCKLAVLGGAGALKLSDMNLIRDIKKLSTGIPVIGIQKLYKNGRIQITPDYLSAKEAAESGADIISIQVVENDPDFSLESIEEVIHRIKKEYNIPVIGAVSTLYEGITAQKFGVDYVATTLAGYTPHSIKKNGPDFELLLDLYKHLSIPVIAEGRYDSTESIKKAIECGAHSVVVGTAITRPHILTKWFYDVMQRGENTND